MDNPFQAPSDRSDGWTAWALIEPVSSIIFAFAALLVLLYPSIQAFQGRQERVRALRAESAEIEERLDRMLVELRELERRAQERVDEAQHDDPDGRNGWPEGTR